MKNCNLKLASAPAQEKRLEDPLTEVTWLDELTQPFHILHNPKFDN